MNTMNELAIAGAILGFGMTGMPAIAADSCSDILSQGIFNQYTLGENDRVRSDFHSYLCTTEFKSHQEALDAGIGVTVPVYGVPVQFSGNFSQEERDSWKRSHCQSEDRSLDSEHARQIATREVSAAVTEAWKACMLHEGAGDRGGLSCRMRGTADQVLITVKYSPRFDSDAREGAKIVAAPEVLGLKCGRLQLKKGRKIPVQGVTLTCSREKGAEDTRPEARFVLNTDKGACDATIKSHSEEPVVLEGKMTFTSDVLINAPRVLIKKGAVIRVENGSKLEINSRRIVVEDGGAFIDGRGAQGAQGGQGESRGEWRTENRQHYDEANGDCYNNGSHQDRGGRGGQGGQGGRGASIVIRGALSGGPLNYDLGGGAGGAGGSPGNGKVHTFENDRWQCPSNGSGPQGPQGERGSFLLMPAISF